MALLSHFCRRIRLMGPISIAELMKDVIADPKHGYYPQAARIGHKGDFITAPELSPVFGEIITAWCLLQWQKATDGSVTKLNFTELGPGKGTLMRDIIETSGIIGPAFFGNAPKLSANLVEISERFIAEQEKLLCGNLSKPITPDTIFKNPNYLRRTGIQKCIFNWYSMLNHVPDNKPTIFICNEFFDALPVNQYQKLEKIGWAEILVDCSEDNKLSFCTYKTTSCLKLDNNKKYQDMPIGTHIEISEQSKHLVQALANRIVENGGFALIIDYGDTKIDGLTFRAFRDHKQVNPLEDLGLCDLTADVNFGDIIEAANSINGIKVHGPITQSSFLTLMGIGERFKQLYSIVPEEKQEAVIHAHNFLCSPDEMGDRFKVLCIGRESDPIPLCFEQQS